MATVKNKVSFEEMKRRGFPVIPAHKAIPKSWFQGKEVSLKEVHKALSKIKGSLAEEVAKLREEE